MLQYSYMAARVLSARDPRPVELVNDEIVLPKTSSSVFISANIDYLLRNLGAKQLVTSGFLTDQCVESAIRDACHLGYLVMLVPDDCATYRQERNDNTLRGIKDYCRQVNTDALIEDIGKQAA
jgi:ureidoacrylate peracid hydrolase